MELSSENVEAVFKGCLIGQEPVDETNPDLIKVEGVVHAFGLSKRALEERKDDIRSMLAALDRNFFKSSGGGWTFLNLCMDDAGRQWTDLHLVQEQLCCLAIGSGLGSWLLPRDLWESLPGGMPYVAFDVEPAEVA